MALTPDAVRRGAVVLVRLPRDKARRAGVVRSDRFANSLMRRCCRLPRRSAVGVSLRIDLAPSPENGLRAVSQVMTDWPQTVRFTDMGEVIGQVDLVTMRAITQQIAVVLGIGFSGRRVGRTARLPTIEPPATP